MTVRSEPVALTTELPGRTPASLIGEVRPQVSGLLQERLLVDVLDKTHRLATARDETGIDGYLGVLVAQRALFGGQQTLVGVRHAEQANQVNLYKALGGGT